MVIAEFPLYLSFFHSSHDIAPVTSISWLWIFHLCWPYLDIGFCHVISMSWSWWILYPHHDWRQFAIFTSMRTLRFAILMNVIIWGHFTHLASCTRLGFDLDCLSTHYMHFAPWRLEALLHIIVIFALYLDLTTRHIGEWLCDHGLHWSTLQFRLLCSFTCVICHLCLHDALHNLLLHVNLCLRCWPSLYSSHLRCHDHLALHLSCRTWCRNPLKGREGTMPSLPRLHFVWWLAVLESSSYTLSHQCRWLHPLVPYPEIAHLALCLVGLYPLRGSPTWHWRVQTPSTMSIYHAVRVVCAQPFWWNKASCVLPTCPLSWLCTLWIALSTCNLYSRLLTCLVACIGCDWKGCTLSGRALDQIKGYKTLFTKDSDHLAIAWSILTNLDWDLGLQPFLPWDAWFFWFSWIDLISFVLITVCFWSC